MTTVDELRQRKAWLLQLVAHTDKQLEKARQAAVKPPKPKAQELPGIPPKPPRKPSAQEDDHAEFQSTRKEKLESLGVEFVADRVYTPAFINVAIMRIRREVPDDDEFFALVTAFMAEDYPAKMEPPYPFECFASSKTWPKLLEQLRSGAERAH